MNGILIENEDVSYLDKLLLDEKGLKPVFAKDLSEVNPVHLMIWGNKNGVYTYPTVELIDWLREQINDKKAIEICSGTGVIGRALGIPFTDSYIQTSPEMILLYLSANQHPIQPPEDVLKLEANDAVDHFNPEIVIGCYVTQKYLPGDEGPPKIGSSIYGVDELIMLPKIKTYINIGNTSVHGDKRIRSIYSHEVHRFPWLFTRASQPEKNEIVVYKSN